MWNTQQPRCGRLSLVHQGRLYRRHSSLSLGGRGCRLKRNVTDSGDSMNNGGDVLARGAKSAQFAAGGGDMSDFEYDCRVRNDIVAEKYGLSTEEVAEYTARI